MFVPLLQKLYKLTASISVSSYQKQTKSYVQCDALPSKYYVFPNFIFNLKIKLSTNNLNFISTLLIPFFTVLSRFNFYFLDCIRNINLSVYIFGDLYLYLYILLFFFMSAGRQRYERKRIAQ